MKLFDTMTHVVTDITPGEGNTFRMYTCGPTVYDFAHIGNYRAYMFEDILRRHLKYRGLKVTQVMNLTDMDDKTIRGSRETGVPLQEYTQPFIDAFFEDLKTLNIESAEQYPRATDHVPEMIELTKRLLENGYAYESGDGSVYYSVEKFKRYGDLAHLDKSGLKAGARVSQDEYEKENVGDFALWKAWREEDGDTAWDSPWGSGRPGWHIECSAMSMKYLGETLDMHTGAVDNIFPHHENEIAQSEGATGKTFSRYWVHCEHLIVEGRKMSKSLGNFYTLRDVLERGYTGREIRYVLVATQYRQRLNFTFPALDGARSSLAGIDEFRERLSGVAGADAPCELPEWADAGRQAFEEALDDDLNTPEALAALFGIIRSGNRAMDNGKVSGARAAAVNGLMESLDGVLGFLAAEAQEADEEIRKLAEARQRAREKKDWAEADRIRDQLAAKGWEVKDAPEGPKLRRKGR